MQICVVHPQGVVLIILFLLKDLEDTVKKGIGLWVLRFMVCSVGSW